MSLIPNHITNIITASPEVIRALLREPTEQELASKWNSPVGLMVDFALIIPTPDDPDYNTNGCSHQHPNMFNPTAPEEHPNCWYVWNTRNWHTKWNGYSTSWDALEGDRCTLRFDSAWSHPAPVIQALSERFPEEEIEVQYADEDLGSNVGKYTIQDGEVFDVYQPEYGDKSCELAAQIKYGRSYKDLMAEWGEDA